MGKWTKGPWRLHLVDDTIIIDGNGRVVASVCAGDEENNWYDYNNPNDWPLMDANAALIAEAGTVAHETSLSPRQLAEQRAELLEALKHLLPMARGLFPEGGAYDDAIELGATAIANTERKP